MSGPVSIDKTSINQKDDSIASDGLTPLDLKPEIDDSSLISLNINNQIIQVNQIYPHIKNPKIYTDGLFHYPTKLYRFINDNNLEFTDVSDSLTIVCDPFGDPRVFNLSKLFTSFRTNLIVKLNCHFPIGISAYFRIGIDYAFNPFTRSSPAIFWKTSEKPEIYIMVPWMNNTPMINPSDYIPPKLIIEILELNDTVTSSKPYVLNIESCPYLTSFAFSKEDKIIKPEPPVPNPSEAYTDIEIVTVPVDPNFAGYSDMHPEMLAQLKAAPWWYTVLAKGATYLANLYFPTAGPYITPAAEMIWNVYEWLSTSSYESGFEPALGELLEIVLPSTTPILIKEYPSRDDPNKSYLGLTFQTGNGAKYYCLASAKGEFEELPEAAVAPTNKDEAVKVIGIGAGTIEPISLHNAFEEWMVQNTGSAPSIGSEDFYPSEEFNENFGLILQNPIRFTSSGDKMPDIPVWEHQYAELFNTSYAVVAADEYVESERVPLVMRIPVGTNREDLLSIVDDMYTNHYHPNLISLKFSDANITDFKQHNFRSYLFGTSYGPIIVLALFDKQKQTTFPITYPAYIVLGKQNFGNIVPFVLTDTYDNVKPRNVLLTYAPNNPVKLEQVTYTYSGIHKFTHRMIPTLPYFDKPDDGAVSTKKRVTFRKK